MDEAELFDDLDVAATTTRQSNKYPTIRPLTEYSPRAFKRRFRMTKESFAKLLDMLHDDLVTKTKRGSPTSPEIQLLAALRYFATGAHQQVIGDTLGISQRNVSNIIIRVATAICKHEARYIQWPTANKMKKIHESYNDMMKTRYPSAKTFPKVVGCVDGTHIKVLAAGQNNRERFRDRKSTISLNVQAICDADLKFTNLVARWHGSVHDSRIFGNSEVCANLEKDGLDGFLLGDSGYPQRTYLMTPLANPKNRAERAYNFAQIQCRNTIERAFGVLKRRWGCLGAVLNQDMKNVFPTITACVILHNFLRDEGEEVEDEENILINTQQLIENASVARRTANDQRKKGFKKREELIQNHFH